MPASYLAIDIGASSGRHILGRMENGRLILEEIYRFENRQVRRSGHDCWNPDALTALRAVPISFYCWQGDDVRGFAGALPPSR